MRCSASFLSVYLTPKSSTTSAVNVMSLVVCFQSPDVRSKEFGASVVGDASSLWEAVHSFAYFSVDGSLVDKASKFVIDHNRFGYDRDGDANIFISIQRGVEIEIFQVTGHVAGAVCR
jgi:hypothetical protein